MMCIQFYLFSWSSLIVCNLVSWCPFTNRSISVWSIREWWMEPEIDAYFDLFSTHSCCGSSCCKLTHTVTVMSISRAVITWVCKEICIRLPGFTVHVHVLCFVIGFQILYHFSMINRLSKLSQIQWFTLNNLSPIMLLHQPQDYNWFASCLLHKWSGFSASFVICHNYDSNY